MKTDTLPLDGVRTPILPPAHAGTDSPKPTDLVFAGPSSVIRDLIILALASGLLFFVSLGARDLWNPNEPTYGRAVAEMAARGDWLIPTVNDRVFAEKPILYYWGALASSQILGAVDEFSLRVPSALAGVLSVLLTYLLVLPYVGRRRACLTAAIFATLYQVFWAARSIQMDILVLASALGVLVPLTRMLDFKAHPARAWALAGLAAGLGFTAKGPVTLVVSGIVVAGYALATRRLSRLFQPQTLIGVAVAIAVSAPWYASLWFGGETEFIYEVLFRQNVTRFVDAWDHQQPWWYFFWYVCCDYAPWSLFLPAALLMGSKTDKESRLHRLSWIWIATVVFFFSLSESKRAPYILPIAPAVAALVSGVIDRLMFGDPIRHQARVAARAAFIVLAIVLTLAGVAALSPWLDTPEELASRAFTLGLLLLASGVTLGRGVLFANNRRKLAPLTLLSSISVLYLMAAVWILPAIDPMKSARGFADELNQTLTANGGTVASFQFWAWRAGSSYYADRAIRNLEEPADLVTFWHPNPTAHVLVEAVNEAKFRSLIPDAEIVLSGRIGSRSVLLFARVVPLPRI